jgi:hypothetical protein
LRWSHRHELDDSAIRLSPGAAGGVAAMHGENPKKYDLLETVGEVLRAHFGVEEFDYSIKETPGGPELQFVIDDWRFGLSVTNIEIVR